MAIEESFLDSEIAYDLWTDVLVELEFSGLQRLQMGLEFGIGMAVGESEELPLCCQESQDVRCKAWFVPSGCQSGEGSTSLVMAMTARLMT